MTHSQVISKAAAQQRVEAGMRLVTVHSLKLGAYFFTDNHQFCLRYPHQLQPSWVPVSSYLPHWVVKRPELPNGIVHSVDDYIKVYFADNKYLATEAELMAFIEAHKG